MKNIHVLPTNKPSRLFEILKFNFVFDNQNKYSEEYKKIHKYKNQNIYITSDEEIKEGDYVIWNDKVYKDSKRSFIGVDYSQCKKIILTTDPDLIKDGIQPIDDDFLEWFVKNPSCHNVKYIFKYNSPYVYNSEGHLPDETSPKTIHIGYELKIPQEKPKQAKIDWSRFSQSTKDAVGYVEPLQETIEEAARKHACIPLKIIIDAEERYFNSNVRNYDSFITGANFQAERMYSLEEVIKSFDNLGFKQITSEELNQKEYQPFITDENGNIWVIDKEQWFNQFKKK
jgi:hypothetical protein